MIKRGDLIYIKRENNFRYVVLLDRLKHFSEKGVIKIVSRKKANKITDADTTDLISDKIIHEILSGNVKRFKEFSPIDKKTIKPLYLFLDKEVLLYAKLKKLKFKYKNIKQDKINLFIENLESKHPEVKRAVVNSYLELYN